MKRLFFFLALLLPIGAWASKIPYAVYDNGTLTFKYGEFTPNGTTSWDVSNTPFNGFLPSSLTWEGGLKHVVFDASFAEARPKSCSYWFDASKELESIEGLEYLNTSEVTTMNCMFEFCPKLTSLDLTHFDTSNVTDMGNMFAGTTGLTTLDLSSFNTSKVTIMTNMFAGSASETYGGSNKVETIYVGDGWTTDGITSASNGARMFDYCPNLKGGNGTTFNADHTDYTYARIDAPGTPGYLSKKGQTTTTTWTVTSTDNIPAGTKYELEDITLTIGEAGSNDFTVNEWGEPYDETFKNLICGNGVNGNKEGGTFYLFKPKKNGNLTVFVSQNPVKKLYVEESGRVMDAFNGISHEEITEGQYKGTYTIPVYTNLTYKLYCAGSKLSFYGFTFEGRNDAEVANITFADEKVKALCVTNWDTNQDGELSFAEAAAVTDISGVFYFNKEITSFDELRFFTGLTSLSFGALNECFELKSVCIPSGIVEMDGGAFASCHKLEYIGLDASNPKFKSYGANNAVIERAANRLVVGCPDASIPDNITTIGKAAFWGHAGEWKDIPASVTKIDEGAFAYGGLNAVNISANVEYIGESAFRCNGLWEVVIPAKVTYIGKDAFNECDRLGKVTVLNPNPIELINAETFNNRANATLYVPVGSKAAYEAAPIWKEFKRIVETGWAVTSTDEIPAGTVIELDDITMTIGEAGSPNFTVDTWDSYDEPFTKRIVGNGVNGDREGGTFYLFKPKKNGTLKVIVRQSVKNPKKFYVEESGRVIDAFNGILPETTDDVYIGPYTIPVFANLTYKIYCAGSKMGFYGFTFEGRNDAEWTNIEFADEKVKALCVANWDTDHNGELSMTEAAAVTDLGEVFKQNEEITSFDELRFFTGLTDIPGWNTFNGCHSLTSVTIPASVTSIEGATFANCEALEHISVDPSNTKYCTLQNCNAIIERETNKLVVGCKAAEIPDGVTVIGTEAFHGSTLIQWIGIPESVTELEAGAFAWCISLEGVEIPSSVTKIGDWAFHQTALWSVTLPEKLTTIGENAFKDCNNLNEVNVMNPEPVVLTNAETFSNCANATLNVPKDSRAAYEAAEYWKDFGMIVNVLAEENWADPYWFGVDDGVGATYKMTAEGLAITNPTVQEERWKLQTIVIQNVRLQQNHSYKVIVNAKIPSAGKLQVNLCNWENSWDNDISVNASNDFQDFEFLYEDCPYYTESGFLFFQNGCIKGTSVVRNVQILDITDGEEVIAEKNWASPYWFADEGTGATFTMTDEGLAIKNPKVQNEAWTPQTMILKDACLQKNHTYKVIVNAKIPSDGDLQMQLGSWASDVYEHQCIAVNASSDFQDLEFIYRDFPADAEGAFVVFQNGFIAGTSIVRSVRILDMGDNPVELMYSYNDEDHTAEVTNNDKGKYKGDVTIPATVSHNGKEYTVTMIKEEAFNGSNITSITIPATMKTIEPHSFAGTNDLMKITVDPANTVFDSRDNCNGIIEKATNKLVVGCQETVIPDGITIIGEGAFHSRHQMTSMTIPESVKSIEAGAFAGCYNLAEVQLPANLESLGWWAFLATPIKSITLPATLTSIGSQAFDGCSQLTEVTALNPAPIEIDGSAFSNRANATLYLPAGAKKAYKAAPIWKEFKETVEAEHNSVYSYDLTAYLGVSTGMEINLENWDPFTAYQFDIVLPNGITLEKKADGKGIKFTKGKRCAGSRSISVTARDNNTYRVVCISTKNEVITGNDGALLTVYLVANENMGTKTCQAEIKNVIMTTPEEKQVNFDPTTVSITTKTLLLGDSNDDEFVNVTDLVATINYILGRPSDKFNKTAADISKNHVVDIFDVNLGLGLIKNGTRGARMMTRAAAAANDKMTIKDLSISAGMTKQLQVELTNEGAYTGFQFDLVLPEGIKMTSYSTTARIPEDMIVDYNETEGVYRFLGGLGESAISGNSGSIINITVKADENLKGRNLTGYLRDVKLGLATGDGPTIEETPFKITDETSGDMNKNGKLDPADVKAIVELIMKGEYNVKADANGDSKVNAADIVVVTNEINKK